MQVTYSIVSVFFIIVVIFLFIFVIWRIFRKETPDDPLRISETDDFDEPEDDTGYDETGYDEFEEEEPPWEPAAEAEEDEESVRTNEPDEYNAPEKIRTVRKTYVLRRTLHRNPSLSDFLLSEKVAEE